VRFRIAIVVKSSSIASPKVFDKNTIRLPSCDQSARSPNQVTWRMCGGKCCAGLPPGAGVSSAAFRLATNPNARRDSCGGFIRLTFAQGI